MARAASKSKREKQLEKKLASARSKRKTREMVELLAELESQRPEEPRYPHQLGDALRSLGQLTEAAQAYERAVRNYADAGFLARAMAMAKTLLSVAPERTDILEQLEPKRAREIHRRSQLNLSSPESRGQSLLDAARFNEPPSREAAHEANRPSGEPMRAPTLTTTPPVDERALDRTLAPASPDRGLVRPGLAADPAKPPPPPPARASNTPPPPPPATANTKDDHLPPSFGPQVETDIKVGLSGADFDIEELCDDVIEDAAPSADRLALLPLFPLFSEAPQQAMMSLATRSDLVTLEDGETLIRQGDPAEGLYGIVEGAVRVLVPGHRSKRDIILGEGHVVGESCLLHGGPRSADVLAHGQLVALYFPKSVLDELIAAHPKVHSVLLSMLSKRLLANLLLTSPLFAPFDMGTRVQISRMFKVLRARQDTVIFTSTTASQGLCIPLTGHIVLKAAEHPEAKGRRIGPGEAFGQETLLGAQVAPFEARAENDIIYLHLPAAQFTELAMQYPPFLESLSTMIPTPGLAV